LPRFNVWGSANYCVSHSSYTLVYGDANQVLWGKWKKERAEIIAKEGTESETALVSITVPNDKALPPNVNHKK